MMIAGSRCQLSQFGGTYIISAHPNLTAEVYDPQVICLQGKTAQFNHAIHYHRLACDFDEAAPW
jgi:hypothetical protein